MKAISGLPNHVRPLVILAVVSFSILTARANPIEIPEKSVKPEICFLIGFAILFEVLCVWYILRHSLRPRFFILWLLGMHLVTYPAFLGLLWLLQAMRPAFAVAIGEGLVVVVEGLIIYGICRLTAPANSPLPRPTLAKCWLASLVGNVCSAVAFPILVAIFERFGPG